MPESTARNGRSDGCTAGVESSFMPKANAGARHQVADRGGHQDLLRVGMLRDLAGGLHGGAANATAGDFALSDVQAGAHANSQAGGVMRNRRGTADGAGRTIEGGQQAVSAGAAVASPGPLQFAIDVIAQALPHAREAG